MAVTTGTGRAETGPRSAWASPSVSCVAAWGNGYFVAAAAAVAVWSGYLLSSSGRESEVQ